MFVLEDDCMPLSGAERIVHAVQTEALPGVEVIACHQPNDRYTFSEQAGGAVIIIAHRGAMFTWYSPQGLRSAYNILRRMDWHWRDLAAKGKLALLTPPVARPDRLSTNIGNEHRGLKRVLPP